jgi:hypothetical protein
LAFTNYLKNLLMFATAVKSHWVFRDQGWQSITERKGMEAANTLMIF